VTGRDPGRPKVLLSSTPERPSVDAFGFASKSRPVSSSSDHHTLKSSWLTKKKARYIRSSSKHRSCEQYPSNLWQATSHTGPNEITHVDRPHTCDRAKTLGPRLVPIEHPDHIRFYMRVPIDITHAIRKGRALCRKKRI
jgi:hypothetical protein